MAVPSKIVDVTSVVLPLVGSTVTVFGGRVVVGKIVTVRVPPCCVVVGISVKVVVPVWNVVEGVEVKLRVVDSSIVDVGNTDNVKVDAGN